jgi:hypothetical protein
MKLINDFFERGAHFQRLAAKEANPKFKALLEKNANEYFKLAEKRAQELGLPSPQRPEISNDTRGPHLIDRASGKPFGQED